MDDYKIVFFTSERLNEFWGMFGALIKFASPGVLISVAFTLVGMLFAFIVIAFKKGANQGEDDDDFDIKHY